MAINVTFNGTTYSVPTTGDMSWGGQVTALLQDLGSNALTAAGGGSTITNKTYLAQAGSAAAPAFAFTADSDTGLYNSAPGQITMATNGADRLTVDANGNLTLATGTSITTGDCYVGRNGTTAVLGSNTGAVAFNAGGVTRLNIAADGTITFAGTLTSPTINSATLNSPTIHSPALDGGTISNVTISGATITGSTMTTSPNFSTAISVGGSGVQYTGLNPGHTIGFGWSGSGINAWVDSTYVGIVPLGTFVPAAGGGFSGAISAPSFTVATTGGYLAGDANYSYYVQDGSNWQWRYQRNSGRMSYVRGSDGAELFAIDPSGNISSGTLNAANVICTGGVYGTGLFANAENTHCLVTSGTNRLHQYQPNWYWGWDTGTGQLNWVANATVFWVMRPSDALCYNNTGRVAGHGPYADLSDASLKVDMAEADHGLDQILGLTPKTFRRKSRRKDDIGVSDVTELGFVAQDVQQVLPEAVSDLKLDGDEQLLAVSTTPIVAALVNSIKELTARIAVLEAK